jgi:Cysteine dioxygenase type I
MGKIIYRSGTAMSDISTLHPAQSRRTFAGLAQGLARSPEVWSHLVDHVPGERRYVALPGIEGAEAWLITWAPGTGLDLHDHGGAEGAMALVEGALVEQYGRTARPTDLRTRVLDAGAVVTFAADHVHAVRNQGVVAATSIHVYAPALEQMMFFGDDPRDDRLVNYRDQPRPPAGGS